MDTLHDNEVDIGEVQVGLCDNMIETNSTIWESYELYHSKDDTFTWESVEMNNELFNIPEQRDAPTKDCKGKGKVDYSSSSRKLKTKGSGWSEESSTSEELDMNEEDGNNNRLIHLGTQETSFRMAVPNEKYFHATVSCQVHKIDSLIKDKLTKEQLQMFEKIMFGQLLNVNLVFNGQLIHHFLLRQIPKKPMQMDYVFQFWRKTSVSPKRNSTL
ncbi:MuDRA-like transposase [Cucumis melo var. makuwa]|uniref:MuDRA-like transposase n=1 Tax=Cucumis melo var. makuwa TaxID=1194695 RepID=A0A5A7TSU9_CUCMM|nr:MuDRA-like transposase [Cucumis melo var. makuwa]